MGLQPTPYVFQALNACIMDPKSPYLGLGTKSSKVPQGTTLDENVEQFQNKKSQQVLSLVPL